MSVEIECGELSSPLSSLVDKVQFGERDEDDEEIRCSLLAAYSSLNVFLSRNDVEATLNLYSRLMSSDCPKEEDSSEVLCSLVEEVLSLSLCPCALMSELIEIFRRGSVVGLFECYDSIRGGEVRVANCPLEGEEKVGRKLLEYGVERLKLVHLEKSEGERLGLTISQSSKREGGIIIVRIVYGSVAEGLFSEGEEILEINTRCLRSCHSTLDDLVQWIDSLHGHLSFLLRPSPSSSQSNSTFTPDVGQSLLLLLCRSLSVVVVVVV